MAYPVCVLLAAIPELWVASGPSFMAWVSHALAFGVLVDQSMPRGALPSVFGGWVMRMPAMSGFV
jgi:hypothetical protein